MTILQSIVLGVIQGITEFLPVSSSGHLILLPTLLGWNLQSLSFDVALHFGTVMAVLIFFAKDWYLMISMLIRDVVFSNTLLKEKSIKNFHKESKLLLTIGVVIIPVAIFGYFLESPIETIFRSPIYVSVMLILVAVLMYASDRYSEKLLKKKDKITFMDSFIISISQVLALIPGTSRSGITITTGLFLGLKREDAAKFSFLLATPLILGAAILKVPDLFTSGSEPISTLFFGVLSSFVVGILSIKFLLNYVKKNNLNAFVIYRILLGILVLYIELF